jgi:hypothetical protein
MLPVQEQDTLARLRAANPASVDEGRGHSPGAQAALRRILDEPAPPSGRRSHDRPTRRHRARPPRGLALVLAALLLGGGAAFAAIDPLGWWSANPGEAKYGANPELHVRTPTIPQIGCQTRSAGQLRCGARHSGQRYSLEDAIRGPVALTRAKVTAGIAQALAAGTISAAQAARFRADLAAAPDSFFREYEVASRFGTYGGGGEAGNGRTLVPPPGVPEFLVCENAGTALSCQDLNGDNAAPVGAGVYMAEPTADWRPAPPGPQNLSLPPGINFTAAEYRLLIDMLQSASVSRSSSSGSSAPTQTSGTTPRKR